MKSIARRTSLVLGIVLLWASPAHATVPGTILLEGALTSAGGGPVSDGNYQLTFGIHDAKTGGKMLWSEAATVAVKKGGMSHVLGSVKAIPANTWDNVKTAWLSAKVANEPEMPRKQIHSVAYARRTATAEDLVCTGCVSVGEMKFDGNINLNGKALVAGAITGTTIKANSFLGDGSKLSGIKIPSGECKKAGEVVKGINADGTLKCVKSMDPSGLPADGIDEISNSLIHNQFIDETAGKKGVGIPDNNPVGISDTLTFPNIGLAQKLDVVVDISNSNIANLVVKVYDPNNKEYTLHNKSGSGKTIKTKYPSQTKTVAGDLTTRVGKNPAGKWRLLVVDDKFLNNNIDGKINSWSVAIQTLSNKKIQVKGALGVDNNLTVKGTLDVTGKTTLKDLNVTGKITGNFPKGTVYTRWAKKTCPTGHERIYQGFMAGTRHNAGKAGPSNYLCLTIKPEYFAGNPTGGSAYAWSAEYQESAGSPNVNNYEVPCALCYAPNASTHYEVHGLHSCASPAKVAYNGYLWASHYGHNSGDYACFDKNPERYGNGSNHDHNLPYKVHIEGYDPSGKHHGSKQINCAVCLR